MNYSELTHYYLSKPQFCFDERFFGFDYKYQRTFYSELSKSYLNHLQEDIKSQLVA